MLLQIFVECPEMFTNIVNIRFVEYLPKEQRDTEIDLTDL